MLQNILTLFLNPKYAPIKVSGTDTPNHKARRAIKVVNGIAAELLLPHKIKFITKNNPNTTLKYKYDRLNQTLCLKN